MKRRLALVLAGVLLCVFGLQLIRVARLYSANWDEAHHLYDGYLILTRRDYRADAEVLPLVRAAAALPLLRLHPALPPPTGTPQTEDAFLNGRAFVFGNGGDRLLFPARMVCMLFSLATAVLIYTRYRRAAHDARVPVCLHPRGGRGRPALAAGPGLRPAPYGSWRQQRGRPRVSWRTATKLGAVRSRCAAA